MDEEYIAPSGETIHFYRIEGAGNFEYNVACYTKDHTDTRWHLYFKNETEARKEFERWRS